MPPGLSHELREMAAEPGASELRLDVLQIEESAGLGFGVCVLLLATLLATVRRRLFAMPQTTDDIWRLGIRVTPLISLAALLSQSEVTPLARTLTPYYLLLLPCFLTGPSTESMLRRCWWRFSALAVFVLAAGLLIVSPARPLFPVEIDRK